MGPQNDKNDFSEVGLPGVENDPTPHGIILHPSRPSQLPYIAKSIFFSGILGAGQPPIGADYPSLEHTGSHSEMHISRPRALTRWKLMGPMGPIYGSWEGLDGCKMMPWGVGSFSTPGEPTSESSCFDLFGPTFRSRPDISV